MTGYLPYYLAYVELQCYLVFNLGGHEGSEPPGHDLGPQSRVHDVECFQVLLIPAR